MDRRLARVFVDIATQQLDIQPVLRCDARDACEAYPYCCKANRHGNRAASVGGVTIPTCQILCAARLKVVLILERQTGMRDQDYSSATLYQFTVGIFHIATYGCVIPIEAPSNIKRIVKRADFPTNNLVVHVLGHSRRTQFPVIGDDRDSIIACLEFWLTAAGVMRLAIVLCRGSLDHIINEIIPR